MSNPTTPAHDYVRPGQVAPDRPAPDNCVRCGESEAAHQAPCAGHLVIGCTEPGCRTQVPIGERTDFGLHHADPGNYPDTSASAYMREAALQDEFLDAALAGIRANEAAGHITIREAADLRVAALEHHLETVRNLRIEYFGGNA